MRRDHSLKVGGLVIVAVMFCALVGYASPKSAETRDSAQVQKLQKLSLEYFQSRKGSSPASRPPYPGAPDHCVPGEGTMKACIDQVCSLVSPRDCDNVNELQGVAQACRGNWGGDCVATTCEKAGRFGCDSLSNAKRMAEACRGVYSGACIEVVCKRLGTFACRDLNDLIQVAQTCQWVDSECIDSICDRLGAFGCDSLSEVRQVAQSCTGGYP